MKKYRLKKWYPSLNIRIEKGDIATWDGQHYRIVKEYQQYEDCGLTEGWYHFVKEEVENNPDFWELIEKEKPKPLFITDDDIEIFDDTTEIISVSIKHHTVSKWGYRYLCKPLDCENFKHFGIEANADKYIEENKPKPLFITEDGVECFDRDEYFAIGYDFNKRNMIAYNCDAPYSTGVIRFKHESNADKYIWRNKPVFSYEDFIKWGNIPYPRAIEQLAMERAGYELMESVVAWQLK